MKHKPRIIKDEDMSPLEKELFDTATEIGDELYQIYLTRLDERFNPIIRREGAISQVHVWSFIGKVYNILTSQIIAMTQQIADDNGDNECTLEQFFREFNYGTQLRLKIPGAPAPLPGGIKRLNGY